MGDSFVMVPRAVLQTSGLSGHAKLVYALLASHNGPQGCFPSIAMLAEESGWSKPTVIKAIDELVANGTIEKRRRGQTQVNIYALKSTCFTSENAPAETLKSTALNSSSLNSNGLNSTALTFRSKGRLPLNSTSFTAEVNDVDSNYNNLTRLTELEVPETRDARVPARRPRRQPVALSPDAIPPALAAFDAVLRELPGYTPTQRFIDHVVTDYADLSLKEEAIKMADWLDEHGGRPCSTRFVLNWLKGAQAQPPSRPAAKRNGKARHAQAFDLNSPEERAAMKVMNVLTDDDLPAPAATGEDTWDF